MIELTEQHVDATGVRFGLREARPVNEVEVEICRAWIQQNARMRKTINYKIGRSSYTLKHLVESATAETGKRLYVSNGAFIVAALRLGYSCRLVGYANPNVRFNMGFKRHRCTKSGRDAFSGVA